MPSPPVINMNVHYLAAQPAVSLVESGPDFVALTVSEYPAQVNVFLRTRAECDALIKAAVAARDLLSAPEIDPAILNDAVADDLPDSALLPAAGYIRDVAGQIAGTQ